MRLQRERPPDATDRRLAQSTATGHGSRAPVRGLTRLRFQSQPHHALHLGIADPAGMLPDAAHRASPRAAGRETGSAISLRWVGSAASPALQRCLSFLAHTPESLGRVAPRLGPRSDGEPSSPGSGAPLGSGSTAESVSPMPWAPPFYLRRGRTELYSTYL